jgi:hypothetical protein
MWNHAGIDRRADGLREVVEDLENVIIRLPPGATEEANMAETGASHRVSGIDANRIAWRTFSSRLSPAEEQMAGEAH